LFLLGPARPVRPSSTGWTASCPWAAKATLRPDLLSGRAGAARSSSPPALRAGAAPRTRASARRRSSGGQPRRADTRRLWRVPPPGSGSNARRGRRARPMQQRRPRSRSGPAAPAARRPVRSSAHRPFDWPPWQAPSYGGRRHSDIARLATSVSDT